MPHPFFDVVAFPWTRREAQALHLALSKNIGYRVEEIGRIQAWYRNAGGERALTPGQAADIAWREVLDLLTTARRLRTLCDLLLADGQLVVVHPAVRAVVEAPDLVPPTLLTSSSYVFLDRKPLRAQLTSLVEEASANKVLLVRGPSGSGKTWTKLLVADLALNLGAECVYLFQGLVSTVDDVVDNLFARFEATSEIPPKNETDEAWFKKVLLRLQEVARRKQLMTWVVADDLNTYPEGPRLDPLIRSFFDQFAVSLANQAFGRWFRLVLLDYPDGSVPTKWRSFWTEDRPSEQDIDVDPVKEYLLGWTARMNKQLGDEKAEQLAADIIAGTDTAPPPAPGAPAASTPMPRLQRLHNELMRVLKTL